MASTTLPSRTSFLRKKPRSRDVVGDSQAPQDSASRLLDAAGLGGTSASLGCTPAGRAAAMRACACARALSRLQPLAPGIAGRLQGRSGHSRRSHGLWQSPLRLQRGVADPQRRDRVASASFLYKPLARLGPLHRSSPGAGSGSARGRPTPPRTFARTTERERERERGNSSAALFFFFFFSSLPSRKRNFVASGSWQRSSRSARPGTPRTRSLAKNEGGSEAQPSNRPLPAAC